MCPFQHGVCHCFLWIQLLLFHVTFDKINLQYTFFKKIIIISKNINVHSLRVIQRAEIMNAKCNFNIFSLLFCQEDNYNNYKYKCSLFKSKSTGRDNECQMQFHFFTNVYASLVTMRTFCRKTLLMSFLILSKEWIVDTSTVHLDCSNKLYIQKNN